jgi:hypothetical protein
MGCWGMGLTQSDEFMEIYDSFMEEYDKGKAVSDITNEILARYHAEFDDNDGVMHDVYFALAKAEWMCCEQSDKILGRVREIISSGDNIIFLRSLDATESDLKIREIRLGSFLQQLQTPRSSPRKRVKNRDGIKELPPFVIGECYRYKYNDGYRIFVVLDRKKPSGFREMFFCAVLAKSFSAKEAMSADCLSEKVLNFGCFAGEDFPGMSMLKKVSEISVPEDLQWKLLGENGLVFASKKNFKSDNIPSRDYTLDDLISGKVVTHSQVTIYQRAVHYHFD